jgi:hypothetical protein
MNKLCKSNAINDYFRWAADFDWSLLEPQRVYAQHAAGID